MPKWKPILPPISSLLAICMRAPNWPPCQFSRQRWMRSMPPFGTSIPSTTGIPSGLALIIRSAWNATSQTQFSS